MPMCRALAAAFVLLHVATAAAQTEDMRQAVAYVAVRSADAETAAARPKASAIAPKTLRHPISAPHQLEHGGDELALVHAAAVAASRKDPRPLLAEPPSWQPSSSSVTSRVDSARSSTN